ncbi:MAG: cobalamin-dependent protein [Actinomycetota bacterium]|nr:cobalamin-dependent protein [Actinomycetota bacterium]MDZ4179111.1 cobalamin-dependent protein [Coriobacteriia bacterium]
MTMNGLSASRVIRDGAHDIVEGALQLQWERWPQLRDSLTPRQLVNVRQDTRYHVEFLASSLWAGEPLLFDDYVRWVKVLFENLELPQEWLTGSLVDVGTAMEDLLGERAAPATAMLSNALQRIDAFDTGTVSFIEPDQPHGALAVRYLGAVLGGDRFGASEAVLDAVAEGASLKDIYTYVFQRAQLELGRLWQANRITVAQEHYATAVTQMVMSQLYPHIFSSEKNGRTLVAACVGGELHEMGMRMVADFFEMGSWDTHYVGANTPPSSIVEAALRTGADVIALSATMSFHVPEIADVIDAVRSDPHARGIKVIVGGYPFNLAPELWRRVGADGSARDASAAIELATRLVAA